MSDRPVKELRLAVAVEDYEHAVAFYRDALGLPVVESWDDDTRRGTILDAGRATLELLSVDQVRVIDEVEVGRQGVSPRRDAVASSERPVRCARAASADAVHRARVTPCINSCSSA